MLDFLKKRRYRNTIYTSGLMDRICRYLSDNYTPPTPPPPSYSSKDALYSISPHSPTNDFSRGFANYSFNEPNRLKRPIGEVNAELYQTLEMTFVDKLLSYINEKKLRDTQVYKAAHMDRKLFSKISSKRDYTPSKDTCLALCFALHLSLDDTKDMLQRAEHALTHSNKRDIVIEYLIQEQVYDLFEVDEVLYRLGMKTLGS